MNTHSHMLLHPVWLQLYECECDSLLVCFAYILHFLFFLKPCHVLLMLLWLLSIAVVIANIGVCLYFSLDVASVVVVAATVSSGKKVRMWVLDGG